MVIYPGCRSVTGHASAAGVVAPRIFRCRGRIIAVRVAPVIGLLATASWTGVIR